MTARKRHLVTKAAVVGLAAVLIGGGITSAATGNLPAPAQAAIAGMAAHSGSNIPSRDDDLPGEAAAGQAAAVANQAFAEEMAGNAELFVEAVQDAIGSYTTALHASAPNRPHPMKPLATPRIGEGRRRRRSHAGSLQSRLASGRPRSYLQVVMSALPRVVIVGGGFSGSAVARKLGSEAFVTIVSIDNFLLFTPMLAEAAIGDVDPRHIVTPIRQLAPHAALVQGEVVAIDTERKAVTVQPVFGAGPVTVEGDVLVIALGSVPHTYGVVGVEEHALGFKGISDALRVRNRVLALLEGASLDRDPWLTKLAVVGAGYSGAELAAALGDFVREASRRFYRDAPTPQVTLVDAVERVTPALSESLSASAARALKSRGVSLALGSAVAEVTDRGVRLASGEMIEAATVVWAAGIRPNPLVVEIGLPTIKGRLVVDGHMRAAPGVYAVGDAALVPSGGGLISPPTAQFALRQGRYLGRHLLALQRGDADVPAFAYGTKGELVSLGHRNAVGTVLGVPVSGLIGWFLWRTYYLLQLPTFLRKARVALDWTLDMVFPPDVAWIPSSDLGPR